MTVHSVCFSICGDGTIKGIEECDDFNNVPNDGCTNCVIDPGFTCRIAPISSTNPKLISICTSTCGDGIVSGAEECDDGNN